MSDSDVRPPGPGVPAAAAARALGERHRRIAERAYYKAECRGFAPGAELQDWLDAEREVDALLASGAPAVEQRQGRRAAIHLPVQLNTHDGRVYHGIGSDLGRDGMFVRTPAKMACGSCLDVRVEVPDIRADLPVFVVHRANGGLGLMFRGVDVSVTAALRRCADPDGGQPARKLADPIHERGRP